jgi:hypothetical protein
MARGDLRLLGLLLPQRPFPGDFGPLQRAAHFHIPLMLQPGRLAFLVDLQRQLFGFQVLVADLDQGVLLDVVADLLAPLDFLGQPGQALGVERVRRIEEIHVGLI